MTDRAPLYDKPFFERQQQGSFRSAQIIMPLLLERFKPKSMVDVGCGVGGWAAVAKELGVEHILGIDGDYVSPEQLKIPKERFLSIDLAVAEPLLDERFDICVSLEVAEHLPPDRSRGFVKILTALSDIVLFSAAIPYQGGRNHINEQWQSYWVRLFNENGYGAQDLVRPKVWGNQGVKSWYRQNCIVFVRGVENDKSIEEYDVVHPERYTKRIEALSKNKR